MKDTQIRQKKAYGPQKLIKINKKITKTNYITSYKHSPMPNFKVRLILLVSLNSLTWVYFIIRVIYYIWFSE